MGEVPLPIQLALLRRHYGISQEEMGTDLSMKQSHYSRLEQKNSDHRLSAYHKAAKILRGRLIILPKGAKIIAA